MFTKDNPGPGKGRTPVRDIPCSDCGTTFGQTANEVKKGRTRCPACAKVYNAAQAINKHRVSSPKGPLEILLPKLRKGYLDTKRGEWYMRVRVRKRKSKEEFKADRIYLGLGPDATEQQVAAAVTGTCARLQMTVSASTKTHEQRLAVGKRRVAKALNSRRWADGRDKDRGVFRKMVTKAFYAVELPDPLVDKKVRRFGQYPTREEARKVRDTHYKQMEMEMLPCACCGIRPVFKMGYLTHFTGACTNRVQLPKAMRKLFQTKLWNLVYSEGKHADAGKVSAEKLYQMGYMKCPKGVRYYDRIDVEINFSLAANYLQTPEPEPEEDEDFGFE